MSDPMTTVLEQWQAAFDAHDADAIARLYTEDALFQGFGPIPTLGRDAVRAYYAAVPAGRKVDVTPGPAYTVGDAAAGGFAEVVFHEPGTDYRVPVHLSLVLVPDGGEWRIRQYHVSKLVPRP